MDTMPKMSPATPLCPGIRSKLEKALIEKINDLMVKITNKMQVFCFAYIIFACYSPCFEQLIKCICH